jgi:hypothetical protein
LKKVNIEFNEKDEGDDEVIEDIRKDPDVPVEANEKTHEPKLLYETKKLKGFFNTEASRIVKSLKSGNQIILHKSDISIMMLEGPMEPGSLDEAYNHSDLVSTTKWRSSNNK